MYVKRNISINYFSKLAVQLGTDLPRHIKMRLVAEDVRYDFFLLLGIFVLNFGSFGRG